LASQHKTLWNAQAWEIYSLAMYEQSRKKFWYLDLFGHTMKHGGEDKRHVGKL